MSSCSLLSWAAAVPPQALFDRLPGAFDKARIARRHIVAPPDWYMASHGWHDRNGLCLEAAESLFVEAASAAIEKAGLAGTIRSRIGADCAHC